MFQWLTRRVESGRPAGARGYAICTAPRSGSNLLCQWLASTNLVGRPLEYFNAPARRALDDPTYPDDRAAQIDWIRTKGATANGLYGVKLFSADRALVSPAADHTCTLPVDVYVYLERRDRLGQALSWARALQTQQYRSTQPVQGLAHYDGAAIRERLRALDEEYCSWSEFFTQHALRPCTCTMKTCSTTRSVRSTRLPPASS